MSAGGRSSFSPRPRGTVGGGMGVVGQGRGSVAGGGGSTSVSGPGTGFGTGGKPPDPNSKTVRLGGKRKKWLVKVKAVNALQQAKAMAKARGRQDAAVEKDVHEEPEAEGEDEEEWDEEDPLVQLARLSLSNERTKHAAKGLVDAAKETSTSSELRQVIALAQGTVIGKPAHQQVVRTAASATDTPVRNGRVEL